jgi:hypothetical protein
MSGFHRTGWGMFVVSAVLFAWSALRNGDLPAFAASVIFGVACLLFLVER